jgi:cation transport ATPase
MNDQNQSPNPNPGTQPPVSSDWREQRRAEHMARHEERMQRHAGRHYGGWIGGAILILLGVVFLLHNLGIPFLENWWALFILIPAFWCFVGAWEIYQANGHLTRRGGSSLTMGILLTLLAAVFLFNVTFGLYWPVLLIVGGLVLLGTGLLPE